MLKTLKWIILGLICGFFPGFIPIAILLLIADFLGQISKSLEAIAKTLK